MRSLKLIAVGILCTGATGAMAQTAPPPSQSADEIVCKLTGDCDVKASGAELELGNEASFSFRPSGGTAAAAPRTAARVAAPAGAPSFKPARAITAPPATLRKATGKRVAAVSTLDMRINFDSGSSEMTEFGKVNAAEFAKALQRPQLVARHVRIEGHTDAVGNRDYNLQLSRDRAAAVAKFLVDAGVDGSRLESVGFGFDRPLLQGRPKAAANRRVQIVID